MSMPMRTEAVCAMCGCESDQIILASTNTFGGTPDLDLRPAEMMRSTMSMWLQECPHCGYISGRLSEKADITKDFFRSSSYTSCDGLKFKNGLAKRFYRHHLIKAAVGNNEGAYAAALRAAWCCDDCGDAKNAIYCRLLALEWLEKLMQEGGKQPEELHLIRADILRRSGKFDQLIAEYEGKVFSEDILNSIAAFQVEKAKQCDSACYRVQDVKTDTDK